MAHDSPECQVKEVDKYINQFFVRGFLLFQIITTWKLLNCPEIVIVFSPSNHRLNNFAPFDLSSHNDISLLSDGLMCCNPCRE